MTSSYIDGTPKRSYECLGRGQIIKCGRIANIVQRWGMHRSPHIGHYLHKHTKNSINELSLSIELLYEMNFILRVGQAPKLWEQPSVCRCGHGLIT